MSLLQKLINEIWSKKDFVCIRQTLASAYHEPCHKSMCSPWNCLNPQLVSTGIIRKKLSSDFFKIMCNLIMYFYCIRHKHTKNTYKHDLQESMFHRHIIPWHGTYLISVKTLHILDMHYKNWVSGPRTIQIFSCSTSRFRALLICQEH